MKRTVPILLGLALAAATAPAQEDLGTPVFVMSLDFDQWHADFPNSALARVWDEPAVQGVLGEALDELAEQVGVAPEALVQSFTGQMGLAVMMHGGAQGADPVMTYGIAFRQPGQGQTVADQIRSAAQQSGQSVDDLLLAGDDVAVLSDSTPLREALATQFDQGATGLGITPAAGSFTNLRLNLAALAGTAAQAPGATQTMNALGLGNIDAMEASGGFEGTGLGWRNDIITQGARSGLLDLIGPAGEFETLAAVPQDAESVSAIRLQPLTRILDMMLAAAAASGDPMAEMQVQQMLGMAQGFGVNIQGLLAAVGPEVTVAERAGEMAVVMQSSDPQVILQTLQGLGPMMGMMAGMQGMGATPGEMPQPPRQVTEGSTTFTVMELPGGIALSMGQVGGHLVIAESEGLMRDVVRAAEGGPNVTQGDLWSAAADQLGEPVSMLALSDDVAAVQDLVSDPMVLMGMGLSPQSVESLQQAAEVIASHGGHSVTTLSTAPDRLSMRMHSSSGVEMLGLMVMAVAAADMQDNPMPTSPPALPTAPMPTETKP